MKKTQLAAYEEKYGLKFVYEYGTPGAEFAAEIEAGEIYMQTPPAGTMVKKGTLIEVTICSGQLEIVELTDVSNMPFETAKFTLESEGFIVKMVEEYNEDIPKGTVIRTDPAVGSKLPPNTEIKVFVSTGPLDEEALTVPNVVGNTQQEAERQIGLAGFTVGTITEVNSEPNFKGYVVSQSPTGDSKAQKDSEINLFIGNGIPLYTFDLNVSLPSDYVSDYGYISAWVDNVRVEDQFTSMVEITKLRNATFKISTAKPTVNVTIKLSSNNTKYDNYITYTVNSKTGVITNTVKHAYPQKMEQDTGNNVSNNSTTLPENDTGTNE